MVPSSATSPPRQPVVASEERTSALSHVNSTSQPLATNKGFKNMIKLFRDLNVSILLTPFWSAKHSTRTVAVPSAQGRTVRGLVRGAAVLSAHGRTVRAQGPNGLRPGARLGLLPDGRTVRALGPDGPRVCRDGRRSPTAPGSRSREGPRRGVEILGGV